MKIAVFSDLHLGDGSRLDAFGTEVKERILIRLFTRLLDKKYTIFLNGDIYEYWKFSEMKIFHAHKTLIQFIRNNPKIIEIIGNHDFSLMGRMECKLRTKDGQRILITHGFQNDPWMVHPFAKYSVFVYTYLERLGIKLEGFFHKWFKGSLFIQRKTRQYALERLKNEDFDIIVCGHTHKMQRIHTREGKLYLNSGHCTGRDIQYVTLNSKKKKYRLRYLNMDAKKNSDKP